MRFSVSRRSAASLIFIIGFFLMLIGSVFMLLPPTISRIFIVFALFFLFFGVSCAIFAIKLNKRSLYLFVSALFLQIGLYFFLSALDIVSLAFSRAWPLLSVFSGLALIPAGWHRYGIFRRQYLVPAGAFIILGATLMIFSLDLVDFSFSQFVQTWWPLLVILAGLTLLLSALGTKTAGDAKH